MAFKFYGVEPRVPTRIDVKGDVPLGKTFIGMAKRRLNHLRRSTEYQSLKVAYSTQRRSDGVVIECFVDRKLSQCIITTPVTKPTITKKDKPCSCCNGCISICTLLTDPVESYIYDGKNIHVTTCDVAVCTKSDDSYIETTYYDVPFADADTNFVTGDKCLLLTPPFNGAYMYNCMVGTGFSKGIRRNDIGIPYSEPPEEFFTIESACNINNPYLAAVYYGATPSQRSTTLYPLILSFSMVDCVGE